jgi:hypothetical protein
MSMSAALELVCACTHPCSCSIKQNHDANWSHLKPGSTAMPHDAYEMQHLVHVQHKHGLQMLRRAEQGKEKVLTSMMRGADVGPHDQLPVHFIVNGSACAPCVSPVTCRGVCSLSLTLRIRLTFVSRASYIHAHIQPQYHAHGYVHACITVTVTVTEYLF